MKKLLTKEQREKYEGYLRTIELWKEKFSKDEMDTKTILLAAVKANKHPMVFYNSLSDKEGIAELNENSGLFTYTDDQPNFINRDITDGTADNQVVNIYRWLQAAHYDSPVGYTVDEIHQGIEKSFIKKANEYKEVNDLDNMQRVLNSIPEQGSVGARLSSMVDAEIVFRRKMPKTKLKSNSKFTNKNENVYQLTLDYVGVPWTVKVETEYRRAVKEKEKLATISKMISTIYTMLINDKKLTFEYKLSVKNRADDLIKCILFDKKDPILWEDLNSLYFEVQENMDTVKIINKKELKKQKQEALEKQRQAEEFRKELNLKQLDEAVDLEFETKQEKSDRKLKMGDSDINNDLGAEIKGLREYHEKLLKELKNKKKE